MTATWSRPFFRCARVALLTGWLIAATCPVAATVTLEFQFGGLDPALWQTGVVSTGILVADRDGDGFLSPYHPTAVGTVLAVGETLGSSDDVIVAAFPLQPLVDWGNRRGFAAAPPPIDYGVLGLEEGDALMFYAFPGSPPGGALPASAPFGEYRTDDAALITGTMGFALPPDGGAYQLAVYDGASLGPADLTRFGTGPARIRLERADGTHLADGATVHFGTQSVEYAEIIPIRVRNVGGSHLTGLGLQLLPGTPGDFSVIQTLPVQSLAPGQSATFALRFAPGSTGDHAALLRVSSSAPVDGANVPLAAPYGLSLAGTGRTDRRTGKPLLVPPSVAAAPSHSDLPRNWDDSLAGTYDGLLRAQSDGAVIGAISPLVLSRRASGAPGGRATGRVLLNGLAATFEATFDQNGRCSAGVPQPDQSILSCDLQLRETNTSSEVIVGSISWKGTAVTVRLARLTPPPAEWAGRYTMLLPSLPGWGVHEPGGDGWATAQIAANGVVTLAGRLGDGTVFTEIAYLSKDLEFPLFLDLYRAAGQGRGHLAGWITCRNAPATSDFDGRVWWRKPPDASEIRYPDGFALELWCLGSKLTVSDSLPRVLPGLTASHPNAEVSFIGPTAPLADPAQGATDRSVSWLADNRLIHYGPESLRGAVSRTNGRMGGTFTIPGTRTTVNFQGVAFPKQDLAAGQFVFGLASGAVRLQPGAATPYPGSEGVAALQVLTTPSPSFAPPATPLTMFDPAAAGVYDGTMEENGVAVGFLESFSLSTSGAFSGAVWIDGMRHVVRGEFAADGTVSGLEVTPLGVLQLVLNLENGTTDGFRIFGTLGARNLDTRRRPLFTEATPTPHSGAYTFAMLVPDGTASADEPAGDGAGRLSVSSLGTCVGLLTLADGVRVTLAGHVSRSGEWSFNRGLYGRVPRGFLSGTVAFRNTPDADFDGVWHWKRPDGLSPFPLGFHTSRAVLGSRYVRPAAGQRAIPDLDPVPHNVWIRFAASSLGNLDRAGTWTSTNQVRHFGPEDYVIGLDARTGVLVGNYANPTLSPRPTARFGGVILQKQGLVTGWHISGPVADHGLFRVEKRVAPPPPP